MKPSESLRAARALLATPGVWPLKVCAHTAIGEALHPDNRDMLRWTAEDTRRAEVALYATLGVQHSFSVWRWNDAPERTLADVLALYDRAIELALKEESQ